MADLMTNIRLLKMAINNGQMPAMTEVPDSARHIIDPSFVAGYGALWEEPDKGLRCPVVGCGRYFGLLRPHLESAHADIGGAYAVLTALDIPASTGLASIALSEKRRQTAQRVFGEHNRLPETAERSRERIRRTNAVRGKGMSAAAAASKRSMHARNERNRCVAQLLNDMLNLQTYLGRSPSVRDAAARFGEGYVAAVKRTFGTWQNAKAVVGLPTAKRRGGRTDHAYSRDQVLDSLHAYYEVHGDLPTHSEASRIQRAPLIMSVRTIVKVMRAPSWDDAMRRVASLLNIYGGRYGLPETVRPKAERDSAA